MRNYHAAHNLYFKFAFISWISAVHLLLSGILGAQIAPGTVHDWIVWHALWSPAVSIISLFAFDFFGCFRAFKIGPRYSDAGVLFITLLVVDGLVSLTFSLTSPVATFSWLMWPLRALLLASSWFGLHLLMTQSFVKLGYRIRVQTLLTEMEFKQLRNALIASHLHKDLEFLPLAGEELADFLVLSNVGVKNFEQQYHAVKSSLAGTPILELSDFLEEVTRHVDLVRESGSGASRLLPYTASTSSKIYLAIKSTWEPILAALLLLVLLPVIAVTGLLIKMTSPGPVFFKQRRLGYLGREFEIVKFRTMTADAERDGAKWAVQNDPRITPLGNWLRKLHIDEIPQLLNIIRGDLSFVGPRPERPEFYARLEQEIPLFYLRTAVKPGLTGWAQIYAGYASTIKQSEIKLSYDLFYMKRLSFRTDFICFFLTFGLIFQRLFLGHEQHLDLHAQQDSRSSELKVDLPLVEASRQE